MSRTSIMLMLVISCDREISAQEKVKYVNKSVERFFGCTINEMLDRFPYQFLSSVHPEYRDFIAEQVQKKQKGTKDYLNQYHPPFQFHSQTNL